MHVWLDAPAITSDGGTAGRVSRLLVHPASWKVLAIAVRRGGWLRQEETAVPPLAVRLASPEGVWLRMTGDAFRRLPPVRSTEWQRPPRTWVVPLGWPPGRVFWPAGYDGPVYPEITAGQLRGWGTLRAAGWGISGGRDRSADGQSQTSARELQTPAAHHLPKPAADRIELELERERRGESLLDVDPYDVLARTSECGFNTAFERDDASVINPQPRPGA